MKTFLLISFLWVALATNGQSPVRNFTLTDVVRGAPVSLDQYSSARAVVCIFTSNVCPYDRYYADRLREMIAQYSGKVSFLFINAHLDPEETAEQMKLASSGWANSIPYLADKDQVAMDALDAKRSPEAFLLKHVDAGFEIIYSGALDDSPQEVAGVTTRYLKDAIDNLLAGRPIVTSAIRAAGCSIRKK